MGILTDEDIRKIAQELARLQNKNYAKNSRYNLFEWAYHWYFTYKQSTVSTTTAQVILSCIDRHIADSEIRDYNLSDITTEDLQNRVNRLHQLQYTRTTKLLYDTLKQMFKKALELDEIQINVAENLELPEIKTTHRKALTDEQFKLFITTNTFTVEEQAFVFLAMFAGLRRGEIFALTLNNIDFNKKVLNIDKTLIYPTNKGVIKNSPKTKSGIRTVPMIPLLEKTLKEFVKNRIGDKNAYYVFCDFSGNPYSKSMTYSLWHKIMNKVVIYNCKHFKYNIVPKLITPHVLRHTYATLLYYSQVKPKDAQYLLGHSSIEVTLNIYTHLKEYNQKFTEEIIEMVNKYTNEMLI